jgi:hypothetical protein
MGFLAPALPFRHSFLVKSILESVWKRACVKNVYGLGVDSEQSSGSSEMNAIRVQKGQFTVNGDTVIHTPTGAKFFARPGESELVNWDLGLAVRGRLEQDYDEGELRSVAAEVLEQRFVVQPVHVPRWLAVVQDVRAAVPPRYIAGGSIVAALLGMGAMLGRVSF